jgi:hypothetical protein
MNVEIINTSGKELSAELIEALEVYAPYHEYREQRNLLQIDLEKRSYNLRCIMLLVDEEHVMIWISDWYILPPSR